MTQAELLRYSGNLSQIARISEKCFVAGRARGMASYEVRTGSGLEYTLLPDKCLDIHELRYRGVNLAFAAKTGLSAPAYGYPLENEFDVYWGAGMLSTCGLMNIGTDGRDETGRYHPLHGRIGMTPAEQRSARAYWDEGVYRLEARAVTREAVLGQHNVALSRKISSQLGSASLVIEDTVANDEPTPARYMLLYHFNFGYPFLDEDTQLLFPPAAAPVQPRTESARAGLATWHQMGPPEDEKAEEVFFHRPAADAHGQVAVSLENRKLGFGVTLSYAAKTLPVLTQWKSLRSGEYVLGIEPATATLRGRVTEAQDGNLRELGGFASETHRVSLAFYDL
jgi:hypothetical protein